MTYFQMEALIPYYATEAELRFHNCTSAAECNIDEFDANWTFYEKDGEKWVKVDTYAQQAFSADECHLTHEYQYAERNEGKVRELATLYREWASRAMVHPRTKDEAQG